MKESYGDYVARMFHKVKDHMGWSEEKTNLWFRTENPNIGGASPDDLMAARPAKFERWVNSLIEGEGP